MTCRKLFLVDLSANSLQETKQIIVGEEKTVEIELHVADISSPEAVSDMVATCVSRFGRVDFGINNAGIALGGVKTADTSLSVFDKSCTVNEKGVGGLKPIHALFLFRTPSQSPVPKLTFKAKADNVDNQ